MSREEGRVGSSHDKAPQPPPPPNKATTERPTRLRPKAKEKASKEATEVSSVLDFRRTWILRVSKFLINNMDEFAGDPYACHLLRTAFQCLAGSRLDDSVTRSRKSREQRQNTSGNPGSIAKHERNAFLEDITVKSVIHPKAGTISVSFRCYFCKIFLPENQNASKGYV